MNTESTEFIPKIKPVHRKICCHCGKYTHKQPQDFNHDNGYGHCSECLTKEDWYKGSKYQDCEFILYVFEQYETCGGSLTSDDSHGKVIELWLKGRVLEHFTTYDTKPNLFSKLNKKYSSRF